MHLLLLLLLACTDKSDDCLPQAWSLDQDGDGWAGLTTVQTCDRPADAANRSGDCDDSDPSVHPQAEEQCNGVDDDCDGVVDPPGVGGYWDADGDGYGDPSRPVEDCALPEGAVEDDQDCDDSRADVHPGASEVWYDGVDQDCLGGDDWDADADGHALPEGGGEDCDDSNAQVHPDRREICHNGLDDDCDSDASDCELAGEYPMTRADWRIEGDGEDHQLGFALRGVGLASPFTERPVFALTQSDTPHSDLGYVYLYSLEEEGPMEQGRFVAGKSHDTFGVFIPNAQDVNGDGHVDLTIFSDMVDNWTGEAGIAHALTYLGPFAREIDAEDYDHGWWGTGLNDGAGRVVQGPLEGDGMSGRLAISVPFQWFYDDSGSELGTGGVYLWDPPFSVDTEVTTSEHYIYGLDKPNGIGYEMQTSDVNGDGVSDLIVYAGQRTADDLRSMVATFLGPVSGANTIWDNDGELISANLDAMGRELDLPGDLDGDGVEEIVLGAPGYTVYDRRGAGAAWIVPTTALLGTSDPDDVALARSQGRAIDPADQLGYSLSHGDFNRDGQTDLIIGANQASVPDGSDGRGVAYGFHHLPRGAVVADKEADFQLYSTSDQGYAADSLSANMDLDGDGCDDILISEPNWPEKVNSYGVVGIFLGGCE